jgi:DNA-binding CsgD family transcriptional regulator
MGRTQGAVKPQSHPLLNAGPQPAPPSSPGVLILGIARDPLYVTPSAHRLMAELDRLTKAPWGNTALPLAVQQVCTELQHNENRDPAGTDWDTMQARHLVHTAHGAILIRGYGIVDRHSHQTGRFLILLESVPTESSLSDTDEETDFQITARQRAILDGLDRGLTNKEIAGNLQLSVHTVKEYIRQLMTLLHTRTRAGIVAQAARLTTPAPKSPPKQDGSRKSQAPPSPVQRG